MTKKFKLSNEQIKPLAVGYGACVASDMITVDGHPVGFMYREEPGEEPDSGWRFMSGFESEEYAEDSSNFSFYDINTIANYDRAIMPLLGSPIGSAFERDDGSDVFSAVCD